jgi:hypothetical protein
MHKDLTLQERLKIAKHFHAGFELEPNDVEEVTEALGLFPTETNKRHDAENLYMMKTINTLRSQQRRVYAFIVLSNVFVLSSVAGGFYWLM